MVAIVGLAGAKSTLGVARPPGTMSLMEPSETRFGLNIAWLVKPFNFLGKLESVRPFSQTEAWNIFRLAAFAEAVGWTLLISAIIIQHYHLSGAGVAIPIAGQIHGAIFIGYFGVLIAVYSSLGWSRKKALAAIVAGVPPYGTLLFELWAARKRRKIEQTSYRRIAVHAIITHKKRLLLVQSNNDVAWTAPGGLLVGEETPEQALTRILKGLTEVAPVVGAVRFTAQITHKSDKHLALFFDVLNSADFATIDTAHIAKTNPTIDEIGFMVTGDIADVQPDFLRQI